MSLAACGSGGPKSGGSTHATSASAGTSPANASSKHFTVAYIVVSAVPALEAMGQGVKAEAQKYGMSFIEESINFDPSAQLSAMNALISRHVSAIVTSPLVEKSFETGVQAAEKAGIPVFTYDGAPPGVTLEVTNADQQAATHMVGLVAKQLKKEGKPCRVAIIEGLPAVPALGARDRGMLAGARQNGCTVLGKQTDTADTVTSATTIADSFKSQFGNKVTAILPYNDDAALGALASLGPGYQPLVVGFNGQSDALAPLKADKLYADYGLQNAVMGEGLGYAAYLTLTGKKVPKVVYSPYVLLTKSNVGGYRTDSMILSQPPGNLSFVHSGSHWILKDSVGPFGS